MKNEPEPLGHCMEYTLEKANGQYRMDNREKLE